MPEKLLEEAENAAEKRKAQLEKEAPLEPRGVWMREGMKVYLCGTLGQQFDAWQRRLSALSAADAYFSQQIGLEAIEKKMDALEAEVKATLLEGESLSPRRSPGYGNMPLSFSGEIIAKLNATKILGVSLTASGLMVPSKSVTAICEIKREEENG